LLLCKSSIGLGNKETSPRQWEYFPKSRGLFVGRPPTRKIDVRDGREWPTLGNAHFGKFDWRNDKSIGYHYEAWRELSERPLDIERNLCFAGHVSAREIEN
jgi:hypothetical protein